MKKKCLNVIPCVFRKPTVDGHFASIYEGYADKLNTDIASTVTARYYKGIGGSGDNMVIVGFEVDDDIPETELKAHGLYKGGGSNKKKRK